MSADFPGRPVKKLLVNQTREPPPAAARAQVEEEMPKVRTDLPGPNLGLEPKSSQTPNHKGESEEKTPALRCHQVL